jgi:hypothetical protein
MLEIATKRTLPKKPLLITTLPGPRAKELVERERSRGNISFLYSRLSPGSG